MRSMKSAAVAAAVVAGALLTGGAGSPAGFATAASAATVKSCVPAQIAVSHGVSQGTAGTTYVPIIFKNTGFKCTIFGVPAIQPVSGNAHIAVGPPARNESMGEMPAMHTIAKGHAVSVAFGVVDTGNYTASTCIARAADGVVVRLGSFIHATYIRLAITVCTKRSSVTTKLLAPGVNGY
jgi:hypothetical protein